MPIHCFWGAEDQILPRRSLDFFRRELPAHATFESPAGYGHAPHMDQPGAFTEGFLRFAREAAARAAP
jgi:pimeloyl-ACP methyl ester carboxylesterase